MIPEQTLLNYPLFGDNATKVEPDNNKKSNGWQQSDVVPAEWMNWAWYHNSKGIADLNKGVSSMEKELNNVLADINITPAEGTNNQLLAAFHNIRPKFTSCNTAAGTQSKTISVTGDVLKAGNVYVIDMANGNSYGDGETLYPTLSINGGTAYPMCDQDGNYLANGAWAAGDLIKVIFTGAKFLMATRAVTDAVTQHDKSPVTSDAVYRQFDVLHPIGECYVQFPGQKSPNELWGSFSTWEVLNYQGAFFRADGGNAKDFGTTLTIASQNGTTITFTTAHNLQSNALVYDPVNNEGRTISSIVNSTTITVGAAFTHTDLTYLIPGQNAQNREHTHSANIRIYNTAGTQTGIGISTTSSVKYAFLSGYATISSEGGDEARSKNFTIKVWRRSA